MLCSTQRINTGPDYQMHLSMVSPAAADTTGSDRQRVSGEKNGARYTSAERTGAARPSLFVHETSTPALQRAGPRSSVQAA